MCSCTNWVRPRNLQPSHLRGRYWSTEVNSCMAHIWPPLARWLEFHKFLVEGVSLIPLFCFSAFDSSTAVAEVIVYILNTWPAAYLELGAARRCQARPAGQGSNPSSIAALAWDPPIMFFLRNEENRTKAHNLNQLHNKGAFYVRRHFFQFQIFFPFLPFLSLKNNIQTVKGFLKLCILPFSSTIIQDVVFRLFSGQGRMGLISIGSQLSSFRLVQFTVWSSELFVKRSR